MTSRLRNIKENESSYRTFPIRMYIWLPAPWARAAQVNVSWLHQPPNYGSVQLRSVVSAVHRRQLYRFGLNKTERQDGRILRGAAQIASTPEAVPPADRRAGLRTIGSKRD
jgi:hypothetical protein